MTDPAERTNDTTTPDRIRLTFSMPITVSGSQFFLATAWAALALNTVGAQGVAPVPLPSAGKGAAGEEAVRLSPFVVATDKDNGYSMNPRELRLTSTLKF